MSHSPSRPTPPSGYIRSTMLHPYPSVPQSDHYASYAYPPLSPPRQQYVHSGLHSSAYTHIDRDPYLLSRHRIDTYRSTYHPYAPPYKQEYRPPRQRLPPPPHPPAPPAPPAPPRPRRASPRAQSSHMPTYTYYRAQAQYNSQHVPPHPRSSLDCTEPSQNDEDDSCSRQMRREGERRARSESPGSGYDSEVPDNTPSPVDPEGIRRWEERHSETRSHNASSGSGSYRDNDRVDNGQEKIVIDPALMSTSRSCYTPSSYGYDANDSPMDDVSVGCTGAGDVDHELEDAAIEIPNSQKRPNSEYYPSPHHQAQFADPLRQSDEPQGHIGLNSLVDGEPGDRPAYPIPTIIKCAILGSPRRQLTLSELYTAMEERFTYYKYSNKKSWRNSVRHNLSLNNQFDKKTRPMTEPGKGHYWVVIPDMPQGNKRARKRNKKLGKRALAAITAEETRPAQEKEQEPSADASTDSDKNGTSLDSNKSADAEVVVEPPVVEVMPVHPAARPGVRITGTLPANAGSYAAVTGAIKFPDIDRQLFRPWPGDSSPATSSIHNDTGHPATSASAPQQDAQATQNVSTSERLQHDKSSTPERSPSGDSSSCPAALGSPSHQPRNASHGSGPEGGSSVGPQRSSSSRASRRYDPIAVGSSPSTPRNAFHALAAQIAREGIGAKGSGGPASRTRRPLNRGRRPATDDDDSDSGSSPSGDGEYVPRRIRGR